MKKILLFILIIAVIIISGIILFNQTNTNESVLVTEEYTPLENLTETELSFNRFIENNYYVVMLENAVYNKEELDKFIQNVSSNVPDKIRIWQADSKGKITIQDIEFYKNKFVIKTDNRWNPDLPKEDMRVIANEYSTKNYKLVKEIIRNNDIKTFSHINLVEKNNLKKVYLCDYVEMNINNEADFELEFIKDLSKKREVILLKSETTKYDYDIYSYSGTVNVIIDEQKLTLRDALLTNRITIDKILEKADKDADKYKTIYNSGYADGGSKEYFYRNYTILKFNAMSFKKQDDSGLFVETHNKDLYIGDLSMNITELNNLYYRSK